MKNTVAQWHTEHMYYELMLDIITYLREFSDRVHHPREDVAFACLARRFPDMQLPLARLQQEHRVISRRGRQVTRILGPDPRIPRG